MANTINTRIVLRNDELSAWEDSSKVLLKGEVAFAKLSGSDEFEMRIGTGSKTWNQLSDSNVVVPDSTKFYEKATFAELEAIVGKNGDIGVVKELIAEDKYSYTAYRWDKVQAKWVALDGNYNAGNVYFDSDISLAGSYTSVGNIKLSDGTFSTKGKNLETVLNDIFDKTVQPTLGAAPSNSITLNKGYYEVGSTVTPTYSVTFNQGKYNTPWNNGSVNDGTAAVSYAITGSDGSTATAQSGTLPAITIADNTAYSVSAKTTYSAGTVAKDNKNNNSNPVVQRAGSTTASASSGTAASQQIRPFRYWYIGCTTDTAEITEATIKGLTKFKTSDAAKSKTVSATGDVKIVAGAKRIIVALPSATYTSYDSISSVLLVSASNTPITASYKKQATGVQVSGAVEGKDKMLYNIYVYQPDGIALTEVHNITVA